VQFDLAATGQTGQYGWVGAGDGLLVRDVNGDGVINDGSELFGSATRLADGSSAGHGYNALAALDSNGDGAVDATDQAFGSLKVWVDGDADGITDIGELRGLVDMGVASLSLAHEASDQMDNGNAVALVGSYTTHGGQTMEMADVWFAKALAEAPPPQISELLAEAPADLTLPSASAGQATAQPAGSDGTVTTAAVRLNPFEEDLLRNQPLI